MGSLAQLEKVSVGNSFTRSDLQISSFRIELCPEAESWRPMLEVRAVGYFKRRNHVT